MDLIKIRKVVRLTLLGIAQRDFQKQLKITLITERK